MEAPTDLLQFLNSLTCEGDLVGFMLNFKSSLHHLLPDVDRVSININRWYDGGRRVAGKQVSAMHVFDGERNMNTLLTDSLGDKPSTRLPRTFERAGCPVELFHKPLCFDYASQTNENVGSILLWREVSKPEISQGTVAILREVGPLIHYLFSTAVQRFQARHSLFADFGRMMDQWAVYVDLSPREREVFMNCLYGHSLERTAELLGVSEATIRSHMKSVRRKLRTPHGGDLVASFAFGKSVAEMVTNER